MQIKTDPFERVNHWRLFLKDMALELRFKEMPRYWIDLNRCDCSAAVLHWIVQVAKKTWTTPEIIGDLVLALDGCFQLQGHFCSGGSDMGRKNGRELKARRSR